MACHQKPRRPAAHHSMTRAGRVLDMKTTIHPRHAPAFGPSLTELVDAQNRVEQVWRDRSFVHPFTDEHLATIAYALGLLSAERLAAGEGLESEGTPHQAPVPVRAQGSGEAGQARSSF